MGRKPKPKVEHRIFIELAYVGPASLDIDWLKSQTKDWMGGHEMLKYSGNMCTEGRKDAISDQRIPILNTDNVVKVDIVPFPKTTKSGLDFIAVYVHRRQEDAV